ncbi:MAG TPA: helix-hairpin-helix domain-containing protein [Chitinophagaceae bacterium]|nr:helix-hairpin-helix domain-containing protein [Chitinophagaceae bacterium]
MDNYAIADQFSLLSKLMDIHGENSFKSKNYSIAAFNIEKLPAQLSSMPPGDVFKLKGIGESTGKKIIELLETGELQALKDIIERTPAGVIEMLHIKGIGPKKIHTIWKEMEIESIGELLYACNENRLTLFKGFGEKTQNNVRDSIEFYLKSQGSYLYSEAESLLLVLTEKIKAAFPEEFTEPTGAFREQIEVIDQLEWVTTASKEQLIAFFETLDMNVSEEGTDTVHFKTAEGFPLIFHTVKREDFIKVLQQTIKPSEIQGVLQPEDIKGIIHTHSNWSDGSQTIEEMARAAIEQGFEYLVISDHSKSAGYANGLTIERVRAQHQQIDELNARLAPFRIFKSIESDILNDGSLDYPDEVLESFDLVIASVHSNLKMTEEKAMMRLLKAIENPYTTILGHMTGRLLLSRNGYPVDHKKIIDACVVNKVVIELNAHPRRLDIDWRWIPYAIEKGALLSIDPDAHNTDGFADIKYGVLAAQKGGLTAKHNLSSFGLKEFEAYIS